MASLICMPASQAEVVQLDHEHIDFRLRYYPEAEGSNQLQVVLTHDLAAGRGMSSNDQAYIVGAANAQRLIPANPNFAFLGPAGSPVWILPQSQDLTLPYLGVSAEDLPAETFDGPVRLELVSVEGPGSFFAWQIAAAGQPPIVRMIATNGVVNPDFNHAATLIGSHEHFNWGFSTSGLYRVTFRCVGRRLGESTNIVGSDVAWAFQILPLRPWERWQSTNWLPATANVTNGPAADPDGDHVANAMEYALALDPNVASTNGLPTFSLVTEGPDTFGALTFTRVKSATDLIYEPSARDQLHTGAWETLTNLVSVADHGETESVTVRDSLPHTSRAGRFYQLRVRLLYP